MLFVVCEIYQSGVQYKTHTAIIDIDTITM